MEENIKNIDIKTLQLYSGGNSYVDDYLFMTDNLENILQGNRIVQLKVFLMMYCVEGEIQLNLNNITYYLKENGVLWGVANMLLGEVTASSACRLKIICFSGRFINRLTQTDKYVWKSFHYLHWNPIKYLNEKEKDLLDKYLDLIEGKIVEKEEPYQKDILLYLSSAFFTELVAAVNRKLLLYEEGGRRCVNQPDFIFKRFIEALTADNGRHRTLEYYADQFCYSPKYLSRVIKRVSGKNALTLIHDNAIEHIIQELKFSSKSIKEIAADFEFSNVSFFAQYVKKHLGVTPSEYRNNNFVQEAGM
mgnify:CR=1 FL=1